MLNPMLRKMCLVLGIVLCIFSGMDSAHARIVTRASITPRTGGAKHASHSHVASGCHSAGCGKSPQKPNHGVTSPVPQKAKR